MPTISHASTTVLEALVAGHRAVATRHSASVRAHTSDALWLVVRDTLNNLGEADRLYGSLTSDDRELSVRDALTQLGYTVDLEPESAEPTCYVVTAGAGGILRVFADLTDANDYIDSTVGNEIIKVPYTPAEPQLPEGFDLDMLAYDIADAMDRGEYGLDDLSQSDFRAALPAFLAAAQAHAAAHLEA